MIMNETNPAPAAPARSKMLWYVGGAVLLLIVVGFLMRGSGAVPVRMEGVDVDRNLDGSTTYETEEGSVTVGAGASMPDNWPSDAPGNIAGASIQYSGTSNPQTGQAGSAVVYTVNASAQTVVDHYKKELLADGWTVQSTANIGGATVLAAQKDSRTFGVYIADAGNGQVSVTVGIGM